MRVVGGSDRGRRLRAPRGRRTRPTADRMRVALFDILGPAVAGMRVLDLFAGTGAVGIEALSRGATRAVFVERDRDALRALRANLATLRLGREQARVVAGDAVAVLPVLEASEAPFDLIFLDPPYAGDIRVSSAARDREAKARREPAADLAARALAALARSRLLHPGTRVVVQHSGRTPLPVPAGLRAAREPRRFGDTALTFLEAER